MAATKTSDEIPVGSTATQIVAANANRLSLVLRVVSGEVWLGPDNTVVADTGGFLYKHSDGPLIDAVPSTDAWYAIARGGTTARVGYLEVTNV